MRVRRGDPVRRGGGWGVDPTGDIPQRLATWAPAVDSRQKSSLPSRPIAVRLQSRQRGPRQLLRSAWPLSMRPLMEPPFWEPQRGVSAQ